jgi:hypothetical protein
VNPDFVETREQLLDKYRGLQGEAAAPAR